MNYNDIVARLQKGETMDTIASELTEMLNKANEQVRAEEAKKKEVEVQKANNEKHMAHAAEVITEGLVEYLDACGVEHDELKVTDVRKILDECAPLFQHLKNLEVKTSVIKPAAKAGNVIDDVFANWFNFLDSL